MRSPTVFAQAPTSDITALHHHLKASRKWPCTRSWSYCAYTVYHLPRSLPCWTTTPPLCAAGSPVTTTKACLDSPTALAPTPPLDQTPHHPAQTPQTVDSHPYLVSPGPALAEPEHPVLPTVPGGRVALSQGHRSRRSPPRCAYFRPGGPCRAKPEPTCIRCPPCASPGCCADTARRPHPCKILQITVCFASGVFQACLPSPGTSSDLYR